MENSTFSLNYQVPKNFFSQVKHIHTRTCIWIVTVCGICFNLNYDRSWFYLIIRIHHCATVLYSPIIKLEVTLFAVAFCLRIMPQFRLVWHFTLFNLFNVSGYLSLKLISLFFPFLLCFFFFLCQKREKISGLVPIL